MPNYAFDYMKKTFDLKSIINKKILLGGSYRFDVADTRYSSSEPFYLNLIVYKVIVVTNDFGSH